MYRVQKDQHFYAGLFYYGLLRYYPLNTGNYNKKVFYTNFIIWILIWSGNVGGVIFTFIMDLVEGNYDFLTEDLAFVIGNTSASICVICFALNHKRWSEFFKLVTTYAKYGEPPNYAKIKKFGDIFAITMISFGYVALFVYAIIVLFDEEMCEKTTNGRRVCGVLSPTWSSSGMSLSIQRKQLLLTYQCLSCITFNAFNVTIVIIYHSVELIVKRAQHLGTIFKDICTIHDEDEQLLAFKDWIRYHQDTISLCTRLSLVARDTAGHILLMVTVLLACLGNTLMNEPTPKTIFYIGGFFLVVATYCHAGQRMQDEVFLFVMHNMVIISWMMSIGDTIFACDWQLCGQKIKRLIPFVIFRTQRKNGLDALPIGQANYWLLLMILKTSYSYLTLLNQTV